MRNKGLRAALATVSLVLVGGLLVWAQEKMQNQEQEREVKEAEVPAPALAALKKLAGAATITEFAEEVEHGHKFYEGSWKGPDGNVDAVVTPTGDVVEIEEIMPPEKIPAGVRAATEQEAGKGTAVSFERKTLYLYEIHFKKDGKGREMIFTTDGRRYHEEGPKEGEKEHDEDEDD